MSTASRTLVRQTERWFIRRGVPQMISGYDFRRHVLPGIVPFLAVVAVAVVAYFLGVDTSPTRRLVVALVAVPVAVAAWRLTVLWARRLPRLSKPAAIALLAVYTATLALLALIVLRDEPAVAAATFAVIVAVVAVAFGGALFAVTHGLLQLLRSAVVHAVDDMRNSLRLQGRALPMLLFVTLFFFFTGELWQAMNRLSWGRVGLVIALFAAVTILASAGRLRDEIGRVEQDLRPERLSDACQRTPLSGVDISEVTRGGPLAPVRLTNGQQANLLVLLATRQLVQAAVVGLGLFGFFLLLGVLVVDQRTAEQWIGAPPAMFAGVPAALVRNALVLAGFGSMYFAVTSMTDADNRQKFFAPILDEVERILAVHAVYLALRDVVIPTPAVDDGVPARATILDGPDAHVTADPAPHHEPLTTPDRGTTADPAPHDRGTTADPAPHHEPHATHDRGTTANPAAHDGRRAAHDRGADLPDDDADTDATAPAPDAPAAGERDRGQAGS